MIELKVFNSRIEKNKKRIPQYLQFCCGMTLLSYLLKKFGKTFKLQNFSIFRDSIGSSPCGNLKNSQASQRFDFFEFGSASKKCEPSKPTLKRSADNSSKKQSAPKIVKKDISVGIKPVAVVPVSGTEFKRNPDDFIGTMQSMDTGKKVFSCQFCGLQGSQKANVRRHIVLKHILEAKEDFKCITCGKTFTLKHTLKLHYMYLQGNEMLETLAKMALEMV